MKYLGLLMINGEDDILEQTLAANAELVDAFYVLDGTEPNTTSEAICLSHPKCAGYTRDHDLPDTYGTQPKDGWRQHLYEQAVADHGYDNWFLLLHGDEVWTQDPRDIVRDNPLYCGIADADHFYFLLPFYFPRAGEPWDDAVAPLEQLRWSLGPGFPELRMFKGNPDVRFDPRQHFNVTPYGLKHSAHLRTEIKHYLYRSPANQLARAARHEDSGFDPDNYKQVTERGEVYWTDQMIAAVLAKPERYFTELRCEESLVGV